jgi:ankyrin repeat protein
MRSTRKTLGLGLFLVSVVATNSWAGAREDQLFTAVRNDDHTAIKRLLAEHAKPNAPLPDGSTVLAWAVNHQDEDSVRLLLAAHAKPNVVDQDGATPVTLACELGNPAIVADLLKAGGDAKATRQDGISALALCAGTSTPEALGDLVAKGADVNAADPNGQTPLMRAAAKGDTDNMAFLIQHGANVNAATKKGFTALHFALRSQVPEAPLMLADAGADTKVVLPDGTSMIQAAITEHDIPFAIKLASAVDDVNQRDRRGRQLIHVAASSGNADLIKLVLSKGGDPNAATPEVQAVSIKVPDHSGGPNESGGLRKFKSVPMIPHSPACATPALLLAAEAGSASAMKALVDAGAKPDVKAQDGTTLALAAAAGGNLDALKYALQLDPNIDAATLDGRSIIHMVIGNRYGADDQAMIAYLADKGAKLELADNQGHTPGFLVNQTGPQPLRVMYIQLLHDRGIVSPFH